MAVMQTLELEKEERDKILAVKLQNEDVQPSIEVFRTKSRDLFWFWFWFWFWFFNNYFFAKKKTIALSGNRTHDLSVSYI